MKFAAVTALVLVAAPLPAASQDTQWQAEKCRRYRTIVEQAMKRSGPAGLGADFLARNEAFIAGGCTGVADVCPRSPEELALANVVTMVGMGQKLASTFFPFACR